MMKRAMAATVQRVPSAGWSGTGEGASPRQSFLQTCFAWVPTVPWWVWMWIAAVVFSC